MIQESLSRYVFDHMSEMVLVFDDRGIIDYGNASAGKLLEYEHQLVGAHICEIFPNEFTETEDGFQTKLVLGSSAGVEVMAYRMNRTCFLVEAKFSDINEDYEPRDLWHQLRP